MTTTNSNGTAGTAGTIAGTTAGTIAGTTAGTIERFNLEEYRQRHPLAAHALLTAIGQWMPPEGTPKGSVNYGDLFGNKPVRLILGETEVSFEAIMDLLDKHVTALETVHDKEVEQAARRLLNSRAEGLLETVYRFQEEVKREGMRLFPGNFDPDE